MSDCARGWSDLVLFGSNTKAFLGEEKLLSDAGKWPETVAAKTSDPFRILFIKPVEAVDTLGHPYIYGESFVFSGTKEENTVSNLVANSRKDHKSPLCLDIGKRGDFFEVVGVFPKKGSRFFDITCTIAYFAGTEVFLGGLVKSWPSGQRIDLLKEFRAKA